MTIRKAVTVAGFIVGAYVGYRYALEVIAFYGLDMGDYWSQQGIWVIRAFFTLALGIGIGFLAYFIANYFSPFD